MDKLSRFVWWLAQRAFFITLIAALCVSIFYWAMTSTAVNVVLKDGMALRAKVITMDADPSNLTKYFQGSWIDRDENLQQALRGESPYRIYTVRGIDHRIDSEFFFCMPWDSSVVLYFTESVPRIDGRVNGNYLALAKSLYGDDCKEPPAYPTVRYRARLVKENGQWHIHTLTPVAAKE